MGIYTINDVLPYIKDMLGDVQEYIKNDVIKMIDVLHLNFIDSVFQDQCKIQVKNFTEFGTCTPDIPVKENECFITTDVISFIGQMLGLLLDHKRYDPYAFRYIQKLIQYLNDKKYSCVLTHNFKIKFTTTIYTKDDYEFKEFYIDPVYMDREQNESFFDIMTKFWIHEQFILN